MSESVLFVLQESIPKKAQRFYLTMFNVGPDFAPKFKLMKKGSDNQIGINHMEFAWDRESCSIKMYVVFEKQVSYNQVIEVCKKEGGGCIFAQTFDADTTHESASGALQSVLECGTKEGNEKFSKGACKPVLAAIVKSKMSQSKSMSTASFDEKTAAAMKYSLEEMDHKMDFCAQIVEGVGSTVACLDTKMDKVQQFMEGKSALEITTSEDNLNLRVVIKQKTIQCHSVAAEKGHITRQVNKRDATIACLEDQIDEFKAAKVLHQERYGHIKEMLAAKNATISAINMLVVGKDATIADKDAIIAVKDDMITSLKEKATKIENTADKDTEKIARLEALLAAKDATIAEIRRSNLDTKIAAEDRRRIQNNNGQDTNE
jgi:hypothetical protein